MDIIARKQQLRQTMKVALKALSSEKLHADGGLVCNHIKHWLSKRSVKILSVGLFSSLSDEIATSALDDFLIQSGVRRAVALATDDNEVCFYPLATNDPIQAVNYCDRDATKRSNEAISELDMIFLPGLAFDRRGHRLGRGLGCFDRTLARIIYKNVRPILVGLALDEQIVSEVPATNRDIAIDYLCTPQQGIISIPARA